MKSRILYPERMQNREIQKFFKRFGAQCRELRYKRGLTQEDMIQHGFATRHYQRIEQGLAINMITALKLAEAFDVKLSDLIAEAEKY